jgi:regulator of PEP synthase PpsR (kinase-PPPase family)
MEYGLLDLNNVFDYGILLFGKTKAGKTTTSHYLTHQILIGALNDQNYVTYQLKESDKNVE